MVKGHAVIMTHGGRAGNKLGHAHLSSQNTAAITDHSGHHMYMYYSWEALLDSVWLLPFIQGMSSLIAYMTVHS